MSAPKSDPVEGLIDHLMGFAREKCVACIANDARMAIDGRAYLRIAARSRCQLSKG